MNSIILNIFENLSKVSLRDGSNVFKQDYFMSPLLEQIEGNFGLNRASTLRKGFSKYSNSLQLTRRCLLNQAKLVFEDGDKFKSTLSEPIDLALINMVELPALSYWYYKRKDFVTAENLLWLTTEVDCFLESNGFPIVIGHRVQQLHNIARIYFKCNDFEKGCHIINNTLYFLSKGTSRETLLSENQGIVFQGEFKNNMSDVLKSLMFWQLSSETVLFIHQYRPNEVSIYFKKTFDNIDSLPQNIEDDQWQMEWLRLKNLFYQGNYNTFLEGFMPFVQQVDSKHSVYVYSLVVDIISLCKTMNLQIDEKVIHKIQKNMQFVLNIESLCSGKETVPLN